MGQDEQGQDEKRAAWDRYLDAWAGSIVETIDGYGQGLKGRAFEVSRKDVLHMAHDLIRRELADAWAHRPGDGVPPEVAVFLAEHDETAALRREVETLKAERDALAEKLATGPRAASSNVTFNVTVSGPEQAEVFTARLADALGKYPMSEAGTVARNPDVVRVHKTDLFALLTRDAHLAAQVTELQRSNTALIDERRSYDRGAQVREFYAVVAPEQERRDRPGLPSDATIRFRVRLIAEEFVEMLDAVFDDDAAVQQLQMCLRWFDERSRIRVDLPAFVDALGDIDYVVEGARVCFGVDGRPIARAIHDANMAKANWPRRAGDGKRMKPDGWKPADVAGLLRAQGWTGG